MRFAVIKTLFSVLNLRISASTKRNCWEYTFDTVRRYFTKSCYYVLIVDQENFFLSSRLVKIPNGHVHRRFKINFGKAFFELEAIKARSLLLVTELKQFGH